MKEINHLNTKVGFIGIGVMGKSMALHLIKRGYQVFVYNRTESKAKELIEAGATWKSTPGEVAKECSVIITMVGYPHDVKQIYFTDNGILQNASEDSIVIDMTTSSPVLAQSIYEEAKKRGIYSLDAPVSGGDIGAKEGTLSIMVGGDKDIFECVVPLLNLMGKNVVYQGKAGNGQHTKMCNQIAIASNMMGVCESLAYAEKVGLDPETVLKSISYGAAGSWSLSNLVPRMIIGNLEPGFYVKHFIKDLKIALESAEEMKLYTPGLEKALSLYEKLAKIGHENSGTQALIELYRA